jgi:pyruvate-ferredoxin/flavodoxin oxidoreductase
MTRDTLDANEAVAAVAYRLSEVVAIYPITPASAMGEHADAWAADQRANLWGDVPQVVEMQSEGGAAGAVHGALQGGALTTTFTASQGLLLMVPDLLKIAGELTPFCLHVAARTVATQALSIFCDHSDVMTLRGAGLSMVCSNNAQEAQDLAAICHAATLASRVPVLHFFDGFRTSHEIGSVELIDDDTLRALVDPRHIAAHRARALDPDHPVVRGTAHNPDTFFQSRLAAQPFYAAAADSFRVTMQRFGELTGRHYAPVEYVGHAQAERVLVVLGSAAECAHETVERLLAAGEKVGLLKLRLFRPFPAEDLLATLPASVRGVAVLDRTWEPGSAGEPLFQDVLTTLAEAVQRGERALPRVIGGRYGLGGKEFTPAMVKAVLDELAAAQPRTRFTVGIDDDVGGTSLPFDRQFDQEADDVQRAVFYGLGADGTVSANKASIRIIGSRPGHYAQGHFELDSKKSGSTTVSHLRFGPRPIRSTYRIASAQFVAVHDPGLLHKRDVFASCAPGATVLVNTSLPAAQFWDSLPREAQAQLAGKRCRLFVIDGYRVAQDAGLGRRINTVMQACFFALAQVLPMDEAMAHMKREVAESWGKRGPEVVRRNEAALDAALAHLVEIPVPAQATAARTLDAPVPPQAPAFVQQVTAAMLAGNGDALPVSAFPPDGSWPTATSQWEKRGIALEIPVWQEDICVQCNHCSMICPHAAIRTKAFAPEALTGAPEGFLAVDETFTPALKGLKYTVQVSPDDCTGCGLCVEVCPARDRKNPRRKSLVMMPAADAAPRERPRWDFFRAIATPQTDALPADAHTVFFREPLFEFSGACAGCGETPYLTLLTRLYGDRLVIANATGCSSIYGGNLPTTPYTVDAQGRGPAWANSLFEDNAEFGFGLTIAAELHEQQARARLLALAPQLPADLVAALLEAPREEPDWIAAQRARITLLDARLAALPGAPAAELRTLAHHLLPRVTWIVGGDGWAYDIGYGGLDHVLASHRKVNVLVLDTEVYSNTGGQASKATPLGASAKFAVAGKDVRKKDLGLLAMSYGHVYVAQVAMQAKAPHTVKAFMEAAAHPGPSLVIAHSPCIAHGYDLVNAPAQQKRAIGSGAWPLYRFDPRRVDAGEAPLELDNPDPRLDVAEWMGNEARFRMVELRDPERYARLLDAARDGVKQRHALYKQLAGIHLPPESHHD